MPLNKEITQTNIWLLSSFWWLYSQCFTIHTHTHLCVCPWSPARRYIYTNSFHNLQRLRSTKVNRSDERNLPCNKKGKKQIISRRNYCWCRLFSHFLQMRLLKPNLGYITSCKQQEALVSTFMSFNEDGAISSLNGSILKLIDSF